MTHYKTMIDTEFLGQWDLPGDRDVTVTLAKVERYTPEGPKRTKTVNGKKVEERNKRLAISFVGKRKKWLAGPVSQKTLARLYGNNVEDWIGKKVSLYVDPMVKFGGEVTGGVRIRETAPRGPETSDALDNEAPKEKTDQLERARDAADSAGAPSREPGSDDT